MTYKYSRFLITVFCAIATLQVTAGEVSNNNNKKLTLFRQNVIRELKQILQKVETQIQETYEEFEKLETLQKETPEQPKKRSYFSRGYCPTETISRSQITTKTNK